MNIGIIPARLHSKRLPKKILANIHGKPMVAHTMEKALKANKLDRVILAIDSEETKEALKAFDFEIIMTSDHHNSGTDRIAEVAERIDGVDIIINIQGDEPLLDPTIIDNLVELFDDGKVDIASIVSNNFTVSDLLNPHVVKAVIDEHRNAVEFKRNVSDLEIAGLYKHIGIYGYRPEALSKFTRLKPSKREISQRLEQLRALDNNIPIKMLISSCDSIAVDTKNDLIKVEQIIGRLSGTPLEIINNEEKKYRN